MICGRERGLVQRRDPGAESRFGGARKVAPTLFAPMRLDLDSSGRRTFDDAKDGLHEAGNATNRAPGLHYIRLAS